MNIQELKKRLDKIAWHEQVEQEISERPSISSLPSSELIGEELKSLAKSVDKALLDLLEKENGYLIWMLRLAPFVEPAFAKQRVLRYLNSENWHVRYWAQAVMLRQD